MQCHQPLGIKHSSSWPVIDYWFLGSTKKSVPKIITWNLAVISNSEYFFAADSYNKLFRGHIRELDDKKQIFI